VQEKQQADGAVGQPVERDSRSAPTGKQAGCDHRCNQAEGEVIGQKSRAGHKYS